MGEAILRPCLTVIRQHLSLIVGNRDCSGARVEIAWGPPTDGPNRAWTFAAADVDAAIPRVAHINRQGCNVYVGMTLKVPGAPAGIRNSGHHAAVANCLALDFDNDLAVNAGRLPKAIRPRMLTISGRTPELRGHLWIGLGPTADLDRWERLLKRLVRHCDADTRAVGRARVMRLAGTVSYPSPAKEQRGYLAELVEAHFFNGPNYTLSAIQRALPVEAAAHLLTSSAKISRRLLSYPSATAVRAMLARLPAEYADDYDLWIRVGFALHDYDSGEIGLALWTEFSSRNADKARQTDFGRRWASFGKSGNIRSITFNWLLTRARPLFSEAQRDTAWSARPGT